MVTFSFYTMDLSVQFNHFNRTLWVAVRCEASGASEATPAVAEASDATCIVLCRMHSEMPRTDDRIKVCELYTLTCMPIYDMHHGVLWLHVAK